MPIWFLYSLLSIFALATAELVQQNVLNRDSGINEKSSAALTLTIQVIFTLPLLLTLGLGSDLLTPFKPAVFPYMMLASALSTTAIIFYLKSFKVKNISISSVLISLSVVVTTILGIIFYNESTSVLKFTGIALIIFAVIATQVRNLHLEKNHLYGLLAGLFFGLNYTVDKLVVTSINPLVYAFWTFVFVCTFNYILNFNEIVKSLRNTKKDTYKLLAVSSVGYMLFNFLSYGAMYIGGEIGRIDAINNSQIYLIIAFEYFILGQKEGTLRKLATASVALAGVFILGLA